MRYQEARGQIQSGDAILFRGRGPVAWVIRAGQGGSAYDHVATAWVIGGRVMLIEARMIGGVRLTALSTRLKDHASWIQTGLELTEPRLKTAIEDVGLPYSFENCVRALRHLPGLRGSFQCAQLFAAIFGLPRTWWTPQKVRDLFADRPAVPLEA